jgi:hypothetical protein
MWLMSDTFINAAHITGTMNWVVTRSSAISRSVCSGSKLRCTTGKLLKRVLRETYTGSQAAVRR